MSDSEDSGDRELRARLAALREDPPESGFQSALHRRLVAAGPPDPAPGWDRVRWWVRRAAPVLWPALGVAAGVAAFLVMGAVRHPPASLPEDTQASRSIEAPGTRVPASRVAVIKLDFTADVAVEQADFQVSLPDGLAFWADGEELPLRSFTWTQPLTYILKFIAQRSERLRATPADASAKGSDTDASRAMDEISGIADDMRAMSRTQLIRLNS